MVGAMSLLHRQNGQFINPRTIAEERKAIPLDIEQRMIAKEPAIAKEAARVDLSTPKTMFASSVSQKQIPHRVVAGQMRQNLFLPAKQSATRKQIPHRVVADQMGQNLFIPAKQFASRKQIPHRVVTEQMRPPQESAGIQYWELQDDEALVLQTVSIQAVIKERTKNKIRNFFSDIALLLYSIFFIGIIVVTIIIVPNSLFKLVSFVALLLVLSHILGVQVRRMHQAKKQRYLNSKQIMRAIKKGSTLSENDNEEDMKHLKLIKEDTMSYLRALRIKGLKEDLQK
jgi:hypothetical protein